MTVVVGTAGHIDHGKTSLLRALTGIDADRLPDEQRRGMTLDVGYAHLRLPNGRIVDFVDVPGHDRLVGNMLVGAGEIDAALLVVAADDGPRAQTLEHLALLDALEIRSGLAVVTKADLVDRARLDEVRREVQRLLRPTGLAGAPVLAASAATGEGLEALVDGLVELDMAVAAGRHGREGPARLPIDRVFSIRGRGTVVTGTLRGHGLAAGTSVRIEPGGTSARVREVQSRGAVVRGEAPGGRTAVNLAGVEVSALRRGQVLAVGPGVEVSDRLLVALRRPAVLAPDGEDAWPPADGTRGRMHLGTDQVGTRLGLAGRAAVQLGDDRTAVLRLDAPVAVSIGDRFVLRRTSPASVVAGGVVLDPLPPRGLARRRFDQATLGALQHAVLTGATEAVIEALAALHGLLPATRAEAVATRFGGADDGHRRSGWRLARDVAATLEAEALASVAARHASNPLDVGVPAAELRLALASRLTRMTGAAEAPALAAATRCLDDLVHDGRLARDGDLVRDPARRPGLPAELVAAMDRLERLLATAAPPALAEAARQAGCPPEGVRALEAAGRIVRPEADLAWSAATYHQLVARALELARRGPLTPATFRDAAGTSRRYVLAILEDLQRRGVLVRGPDGHRPGPRAPAVPDPGPRAPAADHPRSTVTSPEPQRPGSRRLAP